MSDAVVAGVLRPVVLLTPPPPPRAIPHPSHALSIVTNTVTVIDTFVEANPSGMAIFGILIAELGEFTYHQYMRLMYAFTACDRYNAYSYSLLTLSSLSLSLSLRLLA